MVQILLWSKKWRISGEPCFVACKFHFHCPWTPSSLSLRALLQSPHQWDLVSKWAQPGLHLDTHQFVNEWCVILMPECGVQVSPRRTPLSLPTLITSSVKENGVVLGQLALAAIQSEQPAGGRLELTRASGVSTGLLWMTSMGHFFKIWACPGEYLKINLSHLAWLRARGCIRC